MNKDIRDIILAVFFMFIAPMFIGFNISNLKYLCVILCALSGLLGAVLIIQMCDRHNND